MAKRKRVTATQTGGDDVLLGILTLPVLGAPKLVHWIAGKIVEEVEQQEFNEEKLQGQLLDLQMRRELGEMSDAEYSRQETALLNRLSYIRHTKQKD